ncbi:MAG: NADAR family protein [Sphingomonas sp.]|uniref:NADAR family protein n=1 Tax=Sphingomonas sp. TaxID=28214 RepID=UPI003565D678
MTEERFTFFWSGPFSQWHPSNFTVDGERYATAEQYMMAEKARLFRDEDVRQQIMATADPRDQKALGRKVRFFDADRWNAVARAIVYRGNRAKFTTHRDLLTVLLDTEGTTIVEASPLDTIWGIGLAADSPDAHDRTKWRGTNWLGEVLTRLRDTLIEEQRGGGIPELIERAARKTKDGPR